MLTVLSVEYTTIFYERVKFQINIFYSSILCVREVFKKSKWKFKMAFAMKGGGQDRSRVPHTYSEK